MQEREVGLKRCENIIDNICFVSCDTIHPTTGGTILQLNTMESRKAMMKAYSFSQKKKHHRSKFDIFLCRHLLFYQYQYSGKVSNKIAILAQLWENIGYCSDLKIKILIRMYFPFISNFFPPVFLTHIGLDFTVNSERVSTPIRTILH